MQLLITAVLTFITIPVFIKKLGSENYGIFSIISIVGSVNVFANLGLNTSLIKFLAEQGKTKESDQDIIVTLLIVISLILPVTILFYYFGEFILRHIMNIPSGMFENAHHLYNYAIWANCLIFIGQTFSAILNSQQKIYLTNIIQLSYSIIYWGLLLVAVVLGYSLGNLGIVIFSAAAIWFSAIGLAAFKVWGKLDYSDCTKNLLNIARKQIKYGMNIYLSGVVNFFYEPLTRILISNFIGVREVGFFDIGSKIVGQIMGLSSKILYPFFPLFSNLSDSKKISFIVTDVQRKILFIIIPCIAIIIFIAKPFVNLWIGQNVGAISFTIIALGSANLLFSASVIPMYHFVTAKNRTDVMVYVQMANVIASGIIFFLTVRIFGYTAAILGNMTGIISGFALLTYYQKTLLTTYAFSSFNQLLKWIGILALSLIIAYVNTLILPTDILKVLIIPIIVCGAILLLFRYFNVFSKKDVNIYFGENGIANRIIMKLLISSNAELEENY